jgi:AcrR family transcriptional regulator
VSATGTDAPRRAGRHRSQACDDAILAATLDVLGETGYGGLTVSAVIEGAGVSSATLYRRWTTKQDLVAAALASLAPDPIDTDTGSLTGDLAAFLDHIARAITARRQGFTEELALEVRRNPELDAALREKFLAPRLVELGGILNRAQHRGELTRVPPTEQALSLIVGPVYHRAFALHDPLGPEFVRASLTFALRGLGATLVDTIS